jgi:hypothetical protein
MPTAVADDARTAIDEEKERLDAMNNGDGGEGGQSIEDMAAAGEGKEDEDGQTLLDFGDHLNLSVKGKKPTDSEIKIKAISRPIRGQLGDTNDDEVVTLVVTARLDQVSMVTKRDGDGRVANKTRRHTFTPISVVPISAEQADAVLGLSD